MSYNQYEQYEHEQYENEQYQQPYDEPYQDPDVALHRNHSLTRSMLDGGYDEDEDADLALYEDSEMDHVRHNDHKLRLASDPQQLGDDSHSDDDDNDDDENDDGDSRRGSKKSSRSSAASKKSRSKASGGQGLATRRSSTASSTISSASSLPPRSRTRLANPFLLSPWKELDRSKSTPVAPRGLIALPKSPEEIQEQRTIFALPKSKEVSSDVLDLAGRPNTYERLVNLLLIRDTFEPFAVDINFSDPSNGETPLMRASYAGQLDIVQLLYECSFNWVIGYPLDVDKVDFLGTTALMKAAQNGHLIVVQYLCEVLNANVSARDYDGWQPLHFAASKGHWHIVEYLVQAWDADLFAGTVQGDTALMLAANNGYLNVVRFLVEQIEERVGKTRPNGNEESEDEDEDGEDDGSEDDNDGDGEEEKKEDDDDVEDSDDSDDNEDSDEDTDAEGDDTKDGAKSSKPPSASSSSAPAPAHQQRPEEEDEFDPDVLKAKREREMRKMMQIRLAAGTAGVEQRNQRGWTALLGAAHYGQLYVVHYLVSKGCSPELEDHQGRSARTIPLSLLAQNRFGTPIVQPQVIAAIEEGLKHFLKEEEERKAHAAMIQAEEDGDLDERARMMMPRPNRKRKAVEKALVRFKRAERYFIDADRARQFGQFEVAHLLFTYAFEQTRPSKLVREEVELRSKSAHASRMMSSMHRSLLARRLRGIKDSLNGEAQRNYFLAERYMVEKSYQVAIQCLAVCLQYEPTNPIYMEKIAEARAAQSAKSTSANATTSSKTSQPNPSGESTDGSSSTAASSTSTLSPSSTSTDADSSSSSSAVSERTASRSCLGPSNGAPRGSHSQSSKQPRSCSLFGFSFW